MKKRFMALLAIALICSFTLSSGQLLSKIDMQANAQPNSRFRVRKTKDKVYQPTQIKHAYGIDTITSQGENQTIAIVDAYGSSTIQNDLTTFDTKLGISDTKVNITYASGVPVVNTRNKSLVQNVAGWAQETSLDVEWAHALAPKATIDLVVAKSDSQADLFAAVDSASKSGAKIVSMSWGMPEFKTETTFDSHFTTNPDVVYVAASGDNGAGVEYPASSPSVLSVGGTTLQLTSSSTIKSETAWSGSGGGISKFESEPSYQKLVSTISSNNKRAVPDVSFNADPNTGVETFCNGSWYVTGGTSVSAPSWSSIIAIADSVGGTSLTDIQSKLYGIGNSTKYSSNFKDITSGRNGYSRNDVAKKGYDFVTGWGTPIAGNLITSLTTK